MPRVTYAVVDGAQNVVSYGPSEAINRRVVNRLGNGYCAVRVDLPNGEFETLQWAISGKRPWVLELEVSND